jgi:hypothetical protein
LYSVFDVPVGKIIYEMAVHFDPIVISQGNMNLTLRTDHTGEKLEHWINRTLYVERVDASWLDRAYFGELDLSSATRLWLDVSNRFINLDE